MLFQDHRILDVRVHLALERHLRISGNLRGAVGRRVDEVGCQPERSAAQKDGLAQPVEVAEVRLGIRRRRHGKQGRWSKEQERLAGGGALGGFRLSGTGRRRRIVRRRRGRATEGCFNLARDVAAQCFQPTGQCRGRGLDQKTGLLFEREIVKVVSCLLIRSGVGRIHRIEPFADRCRSEAAEHFQEQFHRLHSNDEQFNTMVSLVAFSI